MPVSRYFKGKGSEVMSNLKDEYGAEKGEHVFYALANKKHQKPVADEGAKPKQFYRREVK